MAEVGSLVAVLPSDGQWSGIRSIPYHVNPLHCIPYHTIWHRNQVHLTIWYHYQCRTWHHTILTHTILDHMTHTTPGIISDSYLSSTCTMYLAVGTIQVPYLLIPTDTIGAPPSYPPPLNLTDMRSLKSNLRKCRTLRYIRLITSLLQMGFSTFKNVSD